MNKSKNYINIKNPCSLEWDSLNNVGCTKFCKVCSMEVVDLTNKSNSEIIDFVMRSKGRVCGRIRKEQIDNVIHSNKMNKHILRVFMVFVLGFATIANANPSLTKEETYIDSRMIKGVQHKETPGNNLVNQDSLVTISGKVISAEDKSEIAGVNVMLKGTSTGTQSDKNGWFKLSVYPNKSNTLVFSFVGFMTTEVDINSTSNMEINVKMETDVVWLGEIHIPWYKRLWYTITSPFRRGKVCNQSK